MEKIDNGEWRAFRTEKVMADDVPWPDPQYGWNWTNSSVEFGRIDSVNSSYPNRTDHDTSLELVIVLTKAVLLGLMILITVIGNVFVIAAILLERNLQNVANYLIVSLAVADLMVACLVMPLAAVYEICQGWILSPELCDMWTSSDVLCCTASILHLLAIAVDRYWAVTNVDYIHSRNLNRIGMMIVFIWTIALVVSLAQFGWKDPDYKTRIVDQKLCLPSQDVTYQIFATCSSFYVPLFIILILYWKIFQTARKRIRKNRKPRAQGSAVTGKTPITTHSLFSKKRFRGLRKGNQSSAAEALVSSLALAEGQSTTTVDAVAADEVTETHKTSDASNETARVEELDATPAISEDEARGQQETTAFTISQPEVSPENCSDGTTNNGSASHQSNQSGISDASRVTIIQPGSQTTKYGTTGAPAQQTPNIVQVRREKKESLEAKRERKAAKTLAIITGAFVACWFPFFVMAIMMPLCDCVGDLPFTISLWLGYLNSTLNPVIYTIFSPEFRQAFKRILCGAPRRNPYYCRDFAK